MAGTLLLPAIPARADGVVAGWGDNNNGQTGKGSTSYTETSPLAVTGLPAGKTFIQIAAADFHACALSTEGEVYCWGNNHYSQIGNGYSWIEPPLECQDFFFFDENPDICAPPEPIELTPVKVAGDLSGVAVTQIVTGYEHSCALTAAGTVYCWGDNSLSQVGNGTMNTWAQARPGLVQGLSGKTVVQITGGEYHNCALTADHLVYCWGRNDHGETGKGTVSRQEPSAVAVASLPAGKIVSQIDAGSYQTCLLTADGLPYCWGMNNYAEIGTGSTSAAQVTPVAVSGLPAGKTFTQVSGGGGFSCALTSEGEAWCWGKNDYGQVRGDGTVTSPQYTPVKVAGLPAGKRIIDINAGDQHICALVNNGAAYCWGWNGSGQSGNGNVTTPLKTPSAVPATVFSSGFVTQISPRGYMTAAVAPYGGPGRAIEGGASATWQQIALTCAPGGSGTVLDVFGSGTPMNLTSADYDLGNSAAGTGWVVYKFNAATNQYVKVAKTDTLSLGTGYWLFSYQKGRQGKLIMNCAAAQPTTTVTEAQGCGVAQGCISVSLTAASGASRANLVGNPFPYAVDWSDVRIRVDGSTTTYTPSQAACAGGCGASTPASAMIENVIYVWNGTSYTTYSDSGASAGAIPYFSSFWVKTQAAAYGHTVELLIPKTSTKDGNPF